MTEFIRASSVITDNGEIVEQKDAPIIQMKKLNGQGTLYKLTDANIESINAERESNSVINVDKFIRAVKSNFGVGHYDISAITHMPLPNELKDIGVLRVEVNGKVLINGTCQYLFDDVNDYSIYIYMRDGIVLELDSWYGMVKKAVEEDPELSEQFLELCSSIMEQAPQMVSHYFDDTMFDMHLSKYDKISIARDRVYDT